MKKITILEQYNLIVIRFNEIWLKSKKVKMRMLNVLMDNIKRMLQRSKIPFTKYQLSKDANRVLFFFKNEHISEALEIVNKAFGIHSFSPAVRTSIELKNITDKVVEVGEMILNEGDTFAIRVKRSGKHEFTSQKVAQEAGKVVLESFPNLKLKVDLSNPKKRIFIEVRDDFSYVYTDVVRSEWGGLPIESQKKIAVMDVGRLNDLLAGFLVMRRGSEIYPVFFNMTENQDALKTHLLNWKEVAPYFPGSRFSLKKVDLLRIMREVSQKLEDKAKICCVCNILRLDILGRLLKQSKFENFNLIKAITDGVSLNNMTLCPDDVDLNCIALNTIFLNYPVFTSVIGLEEGEINEYIPRISEHLSKIDYCELKPKAQKFEEEGLEQLYKSLNVETLIENCIRNIQELDTFKDL